MNLSIYPSPDREYPESRQDAEWDKTDIETLKAAARGEILDAGGKPVPACMSFEGVTTYYALDLFGELIEVEA